MVGFCMNAWRVNAKECVRGAPDRKYICVCVCMEHVLALSQSRVCVCGSPAMEFSSKHGLVYSRMKTKHLHIFCNANVASHHKERICILTSTAHFNRLERFFSGVSDQMSSTFKCENSFGCFIHAERADLHWQMEFILQRCIRIDQEWELRTFRGYKSVQIYTVEG